MLSSYQVGTYRQLRRVDDEVSESEAEALVSPGDGQLSGAAAPCLQGK